MPRSWLTDVNVEDFKLKTIKHYTSGASISYKYYTLKAQNIKSYT
jgi:hypothetical protein